MSNQLALSKNQIDSIMTLYSSGQFNNAIKRIKDLNENYPNTPLLFNMLGACYKSTGDLDGALQMFEKATKINSKYAEAHYNLALIYHEIGRIDNAINSYKLSIEINPKYPDAQNNLGILYLNKNLTDKAVKHFEIAIDLRPNFSEAHNNLGSSFQKIGLIEKAIECYQKAIKLKPDYSQAHNNLGILFQMTGKNDIALLSYENAVNADSNNASAHLNLSLVKKYKNEDSQIIEMHEILSRAGTVKTNKSIICFALANAYDDLGMKKKYFEYLKKANEYRKDDLNFSYVKSELNYNPFIKSLFKEPSSEIKLNFNDSLRIKPIFILGMPRSGTTLVEQIIASHSKVYGGGELNNLSEILIPTLQECLRSGDEILTENKFSLIGEQYINDLKKLNVKEKIITDKWPLNFRHIGFILNSLPDAKIVHLKRKPIATCWSIYKNYFSDRANGWAYDLSDIIKFYDAYQDLMNFWHQVYPDRIYDICYEDLTINQHDETRKLLDYCDLEWDENCLNFHQNKRAVETASSTQVRKKMYQGSSNEWKKYKDYLKPLIKHYGKN